MRLRIRNTDLTIEGEREYRSATLKMRRNVPSSFVIELADDQATGLRRGTGIVLDDEAGIVLSGIVLRRVRRDDEDDDVVELSGKCDLHRLAGRLAYPDPTVAADGVQADYWDRSGPAGEVLAEMVELNAGGSALPDRQIAGLTVGAGTLLGTTVRARRRFPTLADEVERLGGEGGLTVDLRQTIDTPGLVLSFGEVADRTRTVVFAQTRGNLTGYETESEHPAATVAIVGGPGEAENRLIIERTAATAAVFGRWEGWVDRASGADAEALLADQVADLEAEADEYLSESGPVQRIAIDTIETETSRWRHTWDVGDLVTVEIDGERLATIVEEVAVAVQPGEGPGGRPSVVATPSLGGESPRQRLQLLARIGELERRVERRGKD